VYFTDDDIDMPTMPDHLLNCAVYIYPSVEDAKEGTAIGGSGFLVGVRTNYEGRLNEHLYVVTNAHVIRKAGDTPVLRLNTKDGTVEILKTTALSWIRHPTGDDLSIRSITLSIEVHDFSYVEWPYEFLSDANMYLVGPGADTVTIGRFITHDGKQRNLPSLRFGNIAMMPLEPIEHPDGYLQESFLVESRSLGGYSGSPVFAYLPADPKRRNYPPKPHAAISKRQIKCIGVDWGHLSHMEPVLAADKKTPTDQKLWVKVNTGMSPAVPAWRLEQLLDDEATIMNREQEDRNLAKSRKENSSAVLDSVDASTETKFTKEDFERALKKASRKVEPKSKA
jgi:hypothetical protein